jgi:hypothetical protein
MRLDKVLISAVMIAMAAPVVADQLVIPGHFQSSSQMSLPTRGSSMERVLSEFGEPVRRIAPIGEPPITEWDYGDFRVYFEYRTVLHTVNLTTLIMPQQ